MKLTGHVPVHLSVVGSNISKTCLSDFRGFHQVDLPVVFVIVKVSYYILHCSSRCPTLDLGSFGVVLMLWCVRRLRCLINKLKLKFSYFKHDWVRLPRKAFAVNFSSVLLLSNAG